MNLRMYAGTLMALLVLVAAPFAKASVPAELAWQGVAIDEEGNPLAEGLYTFHFAIYSDDLGGDSLWGESQTVPVENGVLNILLGESVPIPDSAFAGAERYLQVQFEDQAPYVPRTKIVSVGYAYRASSVDGASGGTITSGLQVEESVSSPLFLVPAGTGAAASGAASITGDAVVLRAVPEGGQAEFLDEAGNANVLIAPDPDGLGGVIAITGDPASPGQGIILDGNSQGSMNPELSIVGANSALSFDMNLTGDEAVSFPANAISAPEILDEPGLAAGLQEGALYDIGDTYQTLTSATATFPADGYVVILLEAAFRAHGFQSWAKGRLLVDGTEVTEWVWDSGDWDDYFDESQAHFAVLPASQGTHTYELQVRHKKWYADVTNGKVIVIYFPTLYGSLSGTEALMPEAADPAAQILPEPMVPVNVVTAHDESVAANQARIEKEVVAMQEKLLELQAELRRTRDLLEQER